jgi:ATP-dependent helicase/nuclease subunit B
MILNAFRLLSGQRDGDYAALNRWLGPSVSFAPDLETMALDDSDWWLWRLRQPEQVVDVIGIVQRSFPHLACGEEASRQRESDAFTIYDGRLKRPGPELNPFAAEGPVMSPTKLESLGTCPLRYFYRYVLGLQPPERLPEEDKWLHANEYGSLMHEVFYIFLLECIQQKRTPNRSDSLRLLAVLEQEVARHAQEFPPLSKIAYEVQVEDLRRTMQMFLLALEQQCKQAIPVYLEASIGMSSERSPTEIDQNDPLVIQLSESTSIRARGRIDRIDRSTQPNSYAHNIFDYKSGGTWKYDVKRPFYEGRVLQHVLYQRMVEQAIRRFHPQASVAEFTYFFPSVSGEGKTRSYKPEELEPGLSKIEVLCKLASTGCFPATNEAKDCKFCDFQSICADANAVTRGCQTKLDNPQNKELEPFREARQ